MKVSPDVHTVLVKKEGDLRATRWPFETAKRLVMQPATHSQIVRRTIHRDRSAETVVTYYYLPSGRWQITETTSI